MTKGKTPNSRAHLDTAIDRICKEENLDQFRTKRLLASVIVGQMLPDGAAKGGNALKIRFGNAATRFSRDLDTARASSLEDYISQLTERLEEGWNGFTGTVVQRKAASPEGVPAAYIMQPFDVKLSYNRKGWMTLPLEVGHNEIGDADDPEMITSPEAAAILTRLGFPEPGPVPCMRLEHQVAQKLHGASGAGSDRAHDLIDLQISVSEGVIDYPKAKSVCMRLFEYRQQQQWPPSIVKGDGWEGLYDEQRENLDILPTVDEAIVWANDLIARIDNS